MRWLSMGMTLVIATGGIDLSVGAVIAIAGSASALLARAHCPLLLVVAAPLALAAAVEDALGRTADFHPVYDEKASIAEKIETIAREIAKLIMGSFKRK